MVVVVYVGKGRSKNNKNSFKCFLQTYFYITDAFFFFHTLYQQTTKYEFRKRVKKRKKKGIKFSEDNQKLENESKERKKKKEKKKKKEQERVEKKTTKVRCSFQFIPFC